LNKSFYFTFEYLTFFALRVNFYLSKFFFEVLIEYEDVDFLLKLIFFEFFNVISVDFILFIYFKVSQFFILFSRLIYNFLILKVNLIFFLIQ